MREYQFVTDGYRLFSAFNRFSDSENTWYNCGPSQKYILRQLKAVDFSLLGDARRKSLFQERASYTTKDENGNQIRAQEMDVALLMLYGHILYAGKSYAYAVSTSESLVQLYSGRSTQWLNPDNQRRLFLARSRSRPNESYDQTFPSIGIPTLCTQATSRQPASYIDARLGFSFSVLRLPTTV